MITALLEAISSRSACLRVCLSAFGECIGLRKEWEAGLLVSVLAIARHFCGFFRHPQ